MNFRKILDVLVAKTPASRPTEHKRVPHDGATWPLPRHLMKDPAAIVARMVEDCQRYNRRYPRAALDLSMLGWSLHQVMQYHEQLKGQLVLLDKRGRHNGA